MIEFLVIVACVLAALAAVVGLILLLNEKGPPQENERVKDKEDDNLNVYYSSEAVERECDINLKFDRLIVAIAEYQAKATGKLATIAEAKAGCPEEKLISPKDIDAAFRKAVKEVEAALGSCAGGQCGESLESVLERLIKKYEADPNQTP